MSAKTLINTAHSEGNTSITFSRNGAHIYTGGSDSLVRVWKTQLGTDQEPEAVLDAMECVTCVAAGRNHWFSGSGDAEVRQYEDGKSTFDALVTGAIGVPIRSIAINPQGSRIAVASDEPSIKVIDLEDTTKMMVLRGHSKAVRRVTWHPSGALLTSCGADGNIIVWDVSEEEPKEVEVIQGTLPAVPDPESPEWQHDCSAVWHTSGEHFYVATRAHEIATISRSKWSRSATFTDEACSGAVTALAMSTNGVYLASASKAGLFIWATQNRRLIYRRFQDSLTAPITQMAWSPSQNLLAWTDNEGVLTRWQECIPPDGIDPVRPSAAASRVLTTAKKRVDASGLFDFVTEDAKELAGDPDADMADVTEGAMVDLDDDWILDDLGGGMNDDDEKEKDRKFDGAGFREMVSVTKAQPPFQPGSTPMENKKRYLAYNMIGVIEVTDQDTHHIVNVEFHDRSLRKGYHFTDHFKYNLAALGERGAVYACQREAEHPAHVIYKPYGNWASQSEWTYELPPAATVLGIAAGGAPPSKSLRSANDADVQGQGTVVIATSDHQLIFLTGSGVERYIMSLQGDFVSMVAGQEWVFVVHREGSTTMDGSQNLTGRLIKFEDFCLLQKDSLPIPKGRTLKWLGITEEGAPALYDSAGVLNILPRFRIPFQATWTCLLNTNTLERRQGKVESYWPVGVSGDTFMCLILKGQQEHPGFPRPLIQELPCRLPFRRSDSKEQPLEEHIARESMLLDILRDGLPDDELTTDDIARRELALDKEIIQLIQVACKNDKPGRAIDLTKLLHHNASFGVALKVAGFYHLIGLQEKMEMLKEDREDTDRLVVARDRRREQ
ncbi:WD40-repeat-containing domain protein, partial [Cytidiella melzeri]